MKDFRAFDANWVAFIKPLPLRLRDLCEGGGRNIIRARGDRKLQGNQLPDTMGLVACELTETVTTSIRLAQVQGRHC